MTTSPSDLQARLKGLLGFPVTPYGDDGELNLDVFAMQVDVLLEHGAQAIFPGCGTGEMQSLTPDEHRRLVARCVRHVDGRVPVLAAVGFGVSTAVEMGVAACDEGADGLLVFPPYLPARNSDALEIYYRTVAKAVPVGVVVYQRDGVVFAPEALARLAAVDNIIGLKDGEGRIDVLQRQRAAVADPRFLFLNGLPTAELFAPALRTFGIVTYSSALLNCLPEAASRFYAAWASGDDATTDQLMRDLILPFVELRDRAPGYAVSLVKAGARLRGLQVGPVRAPLPEPTERDVDDLRRLFERLGLTASLAPTGVGAAS